MERSFGKQMSKHFLFDEGWLNMNHGSFGAVPRLVWDRLRACQQMVEATPDKFVRYDYNQELIASRKAIAELVKAPLDSIVLVPNATSGIDTILRNLSYGPSDHIILLDTVYGACERTVHHLVETTEVQLTRIPLVYPIEDDELISAFRQIVQAIHARGEVARVAVFDIISFQPGVRTPFEALVKACRELGVLSCVDGAHCIGQIPIDLAALNPDFFVSNLHKWLFVPRGCAILYAPVRNQHLLRTTFPTSWGFTPRHEAKFNSYFRQGPGWQSPFEVLFESFGTMDYSPFLCIRDALEFRASIGGEEAIMRHNTKLAAAGGQAMAMILGTEVLDNLQGTLTRGCNMVNVRLPIPHPPPAGGDTPEIIEWISRQLVEKYKTYVPVFEHGGNIWIRVSAQIYLELEDFRFLACALSQLCHNLRGGKRSLCAELDSKST
ncbi:hypothetical protein F1880_009670 [Penicillium rolfsii]|nr:hypothetical protein F1880_009670 [Penicillium rolfsii]